MPSSENESKYHEKLTGKASQKPIGQLDLLGNQMDSIGDSDQFDCGDSSLTDIRSNSEDDKPSSEGEFDFRRLLIIDTETTGLNSSQDECLELAGILFDLPSRNVLAQQSFLFPVFSNDAERINKIPAQITRIDQQWEKGLEYFMALYNCADILVAHNAAFDREWFGQGYMPSLDKPWLCTMEDISWPDNRSLKQRPSVRDLALAYEIPVWSAHRALSDCIYLAEVFRRCDDLEVLIRQGLEPKILMKAIVSYEERYLAKAAGFTWNSPVRGCWSRRLSQRQVSNLDFEVAPVDIDS